MFAAEILALDASVCVNPPADVGLGTSASVVSVSVSNTHSTEFDGLHILHCIGYVNDNALGQVVSSTVVGLVCFFHKTSLEMREDCIGYRNAFDTDTATPKKNKFK